MSQNISLWAGKKAIARIRDSGLHPDDVRIVAGAAGGPKWLVLSGLDRVLFTKWFADRKTPLFLLGSSIGSWRFAAMSQHDPLAALDRFQEAYINQAYLTKPTAAEVSQKSEHILKTLMGAGGEAEILTHPFFRLNVMTVRCKGLTGSDKKSSLLPGLMLSALGNLVNRRSLKLFFERTLFFDPRDVPPFYDMNGFPISQVPLTTRNLNAGLIASGSIPYVMSGVNGIPGAPEGTYRDGGVIDYHLDIPFLDKEEGIVLYPHYTDRIIPGWLDKQIPWHKASPAHMENVLVVSPSRDFVSRLPHRKIPDRNDFYKFAGRDKERIAYWNHTADISNAIADEFMDAVASGRIRDLIRPMAELTG